MIAHLEQARKHRLIDTLRLAGITDERVLQVIEETPREMFLPHALKDQAYEDRALPIERGQTISQPYIVAAMTEALALSDRDTVLEIGTGSGYQTCILSKLCRRVYTIERHKPLLKGAEQIFDTMRLRNITAIAGDGMQGWPKPLLKALGSSPFDKIICTAAAREKPPEPLLEQLRTGGILVLPVDQGGTQNLVLYKKEGDDTFAVKTLMPVRFVPLLPNIASDNENFDS